MTADEFKWIHYNVCIMCAVSRPEDCSSEHQMQVIMTGECSGRLFCLSHEELDEDNDDER